MLAKEKEERQQKLKRYIIELSNKLLSETESIEEMADKLLELYKDNGFRHNYSDFFPLILDISKEDSEGDIDTLSENLQTIRLFVESVYVKKVRKYNTLYPHLEKLCDHLNLEIARLNYYSKNENKISDIESQTALLLQKFQSTKEDLKFSNLLIEQAREQLQVTNKQLSDTKEELAVAKKELDEASDKVKSLQVDVIAVLSIFAGIVFAFSGGFTYLGSVMTSIREVQHYEAVVLMAIICGIVVFNTLFLLLYLVGKITKRNIYAKCKTEDCSCEKKCYGVKKIRKRLPYVYWFNLFAIIGIIINCAVWYCDIRNWFYL